MPRKSLVCLLVGLLAVSLLWAQAPPQKPADKPEDKAARKPALDPATQRLIDQLGDLDYRKRDEAARRLDAMGEKALPYLRAARKHTDPEVRRRAAELLGPIEYATVLAPKRVTLTLEKKTAAEVIQALGKQTGYAIDLAPGPAPKAGKADEQFTFRWKDVPLWQALDEVCRAAGLGLQQSFGDTHLRLQAQGRCAPYVCQAGAFCITAGGFQQTRTIDFSASARGRPEVARWDEMMFAFTVHAEPRLPLLGVGEPHFTAAYDDEGNSMIPPAGSQRTDPPNPQLFGYRPGRYSYGGQRMLTLTGQANLCRPSSKAGAVKLLSGTVPVTVLVEQKPEVVTEHLADAKGKKLRAGSTTFVVEDVTETAAKQTQVRLSITDDDSFSSGPNDYTWMNSLWGRLEVYDEKGKRMTNNGNSWSGNGPNHVNMTMTYAAGGKPTKLVYHVWTTLNTQLAFEFKGLPLP
jgi:HEAT repeat protein